MSLSQEVLDGIQYAHVEQLRGFALPTEDLTAEDGQWVTKEELLGYIEHHLPAVQAAQIAECKSRSPGEPNWDAVFFTLIESSAMNLRKNDLIVEATRTLQTADDKEKEDAQEKAKALIKSSQTDIDEIASALGCTFVQLCEFSRASPDGLPKLCGAYGGVFVSKDDFKLKPFMSVAFKGTTLQAEKNTDVDYVPIVPKIGVALDAETHRGFYHGLFGTYTMPGGSQIPFEHLMKQLDLTYSDCPSALVHFTGHSLGAAYATLLFAEFLRQQINDEERFTKYNVGDLYILGAPRVSQQPFADNLENMTSEDKKKFVFRIVNGKDPICTIPPMRAKEFLWYKYVHVDGGWHLTNHGPHPMHTEQAPHGVPVDPLPVPPLVKDIPDHLPRHYYAGWLKTPYTKALQSTEAFL